jgi:hypothetical protein
MAIGSTSKLLTLSLRRQTITVSDSTFLTCTRSTSSTVSARSHLLTHCRERRRRLFGAKTGSQMSNTACQRLPKRRTAAARESFTCLALPTHSTSLSKRFTLHTLCHIPTRNSSSILMITRRFSSSTMVKREVYWTRRCSASHSVVYRFLSLQLRILRMGI